MKRKILLLFMVLSVYITGKADPVNVTVPSAGMLEAQLGAYTLSDITDLTVSGTIDARDFRLIRDELSNLEKLNLAATTIAAYSGTSGTNVNLMNGSRDFQTAYNANSLPAFAFFAPPVTGGTILNPIVISPEISLSLQSLQLPSGITAIGNSALKKLLSLTSLDLSAYTQLETIGDNAFEQDSILGSIVLPSSIKSIGSYAFQDCAALASFTVPSATTSLGYSLLSGCANISEINFETPSSLTSISAGFFAGMPNLKKVIIPASITDLPAGAFIYNSNTYFTGDSIGVDPNNPAYLSNNGILYNKAGSQLIICPAGLTAPTILPTAVSINGEAFRYGKLTAITIPASVKTIGANAFSNTKLVSLSFDAGSQLDSIANQAFYRDTFLVSVQLPPSLRILGNDVFNGSYGLEEITLPAGIASIGNSTFAYSGIASADFSALTGLINWGVSTFQMCDNLTSVQLPPNYATIPGSTFASCRALKSLNIPSYIKTIDGSAFSSSGLETVTLPEGLETINSSAFAITSLRSVFVPKTVTSLQQGTMGSPFNRIPGRITVDPENPNYSSIDGILYSKDTTSLIEAPTFLSGSFVLPNTVTTIEIYAFQHDSLLTSVELPASLLETQPIKNNAFASCTALRQVVVRSLTPPVFTNSQSPFGSLTVANCVLYVPKGTVDAYREANQWKTFGSIRETGLFYDLGYGYPYKLSPSGKYLTGFNGFLWENKENGDNSVTRIPQGEGAHDVNDDGVITADFPDSKYMVNGNPITSGGVYKDGTWYSLGLGRYGNTTNSAEAGSSVNAITADGWVFGMSYEKNAISKVVPMVWKPNPETGEYTDTLVYRFPEDDLPIADRLQGTRFYDASEHGEIACGWTVHAATKGGRQSIVWTSPTDYKIIAPETLGEAHDVSPNGKYVALTTNRRAAIYDVENDSLFVFGPEETTASAVSNDGLMVGFRNTAVEGRKGFLWSDQLGYIELKDFIEKYTPEITLSEDFQFSDDENDFYMDVPMTVSADGLTVSGWRGAGAIRKIWVISLSAPLDLVNRPYALNVDVDPQTRNEAVLNWSAPKETGEHVLDFYYIYRNGTFLAQIESDQTTYTDSDAPAGNNVYTVSAVYDYEPASSTYRESNPSEPARTSIVDNYDLPFYDGFDADYTANYWDVSPLTFSNGWTLSALNYKGALGASAIFVTGGDRTVYSHTLTSKPLDAGEANLVTASFLYQINTASDILVGIKDTVYFEVSDIRSAEWTTVKSYVLASKINWLAETIDITDLVKGQIFRARFRAVSGANRNVMTFNLDEFAVAVAPVDAPGEVKALRKAGSTEVGVIWQDPSGSYGLTYAQSIKRSTTMGNEGVPFIAVNKFDPAELSIYKDMYLTSISAYINADGKSATSATKLKLAIFSGTNRIVTQEIESFEGDAWNTFALEEPLKITADASLMFGIEVAEHDVHSYPLATDNSMGISEKSDLLSEDGGATWQTLADWEFPYSWSIIGNVRETASASGRIPGILGYEIYRDDVKINTGLTFGQAFTDTTLTNKEEVCYKVKAYYIVGGISEFSEAGCADKENGLLELPSENISIYPNPASEFVYVEGNISSITVYDLTGRPILLAKESPVNVKSLNAGTYAVEVISANGTKTLSKIIIQK